MSERAALRERIAEALRGLTSDYPDVWPRSDVLAAVDEVFAAAEGELDEVEAAPADMSVECADCGVIVRYVHRYPKGMVPERSHSVTRVRLQ